MDSDYFNDFSLPGIDDWTFDDGWLDEPVDMTDDDDDFLEQTFEETDDGVYFDDSEVEYSSCHEDWEDEC